MRNFFLVLTCWLGFAGMAWGQCDGGRISLTTGDTIAVVCSRDGVADFISFQTTSLDTGYTYILTDDRNVIIVELTGDSLDIDPLGGFNLRIWGLSYTGNKRVTPGFQLSSLPLATLCQDLSDNFIPIVGANVDGGAIASNRGFTSLQFCVGDGLADPLMMVNSSTSSEPYEYVLADDQGRYISTITSSIIDFENDAPGQVRVYGISYTGALTLQPGDSLATSTLSSGCFSLSGNFIRIDKISADAGSVYAANGDSVINVCIDGISDMVQFVNTSSSTSNYTYIVTTPSEMILVALTGDNIDFEVSGVGSYRVYGVAHQGVLNARPMQQLRSLNTNCLGFSDNYITIESTLPPSAGRVAFANGDTTSTICVGDGSPDLLTLTTTGVDTPYVFVVTNTRDEILAAFPGTSATVDFDGSPSPDTCRVYGVSYSGNLSIIPGRPLRSGVASGCNSISDNFITIEKVSPDGGRVFALPGTFNVEVCLIGGGSAWVEFANTSVSSLNYTYVVTTPADVVIDYNNNDSIDFSVYPTGTYKVWGLSYRGSLIQVQGQRIDTAINSNDCFAVSSNPVTVQSSAVDGGTISSNSAQTFGDSILTCSGDGLADSILTTVNQGATNGINMLVFTDTNNVIRYTDQFGIDGDTLMGFPLRIWNLNYTGSLELALGDTADVAVLSSECYDLSSNFLLLLEPRTDGGRVAAFPGGFSVRACISGFSTPLTFLNSSAAPNLPYSYYVTDDQDVILTVSSSSQINFTNIQQLFGLSTYHVWGVSYFTSIATARGQRIDTANLGTSCYAISSNFVEVTTQVADGGVLSGPVGGVATVCPGDGIADTFAIAVTKQQSGNAYAYLITDTLENIVQVSQSWPVDFDGFTRFPLRVWGLAYNDSLTAAPGQNAISGNLAIGCFELSANFLTVEGSQTDGGRVFEGSGQLSLEYCLDGKEDEAVFHNTSSASSSYTYFITDQRLTVIAVLTDSVFDFESLPASTYQVYGISYDGAMPVQRGQNIARGLGTGCFSLSSNFVTVEVKGDCIVEVCFLEDFKPGEFGAWSVWMKGLWGSPGYNYTFPRNQGMLIIYGDGTARIVGRILNKADARYQWDIDLALRNKSDWASWSAMGRGYASPSKPFALSNHPFWDFWELDPNGTNVFTGVPGTLFAGKNLNITHRPSNLSKGFQKGQGANDKNAMFGFSGWFYFTGSYNGIGDFNNTIRCSDSDFALGLAETYLKNLEDGSGEKSTKGDKRSASSFDPGSNDIRVKAYPTVFYKTLTIDCPEAGDYEVSLYQINGKQVMSSNLNLKEGANRLDLSEHAKGVYILRIQGADGQSVSTRIIKQ